MRTQTALALSALLAIGCGDSAPPAVGVDDVPVDTTSLDTSPVDTAPPPQDNAPPPVDVPLPPEDAPPPPVDTPPPPVDVPAPEDALPPPIDTPPPTDTSPPIDTPPPMDVGPTCMTGLSLCGSTCVDLMTSGLNCGACDRTCLAGQTCVSGACRLVCATGQSDCSGVCVDLQADRTNCGTCGTTCVGSQSCAMGACRVVCPAGQTACSDACVTLTSDVANCGTCGMRCASGLSCVSGACALVCPAGQAACSGACVDQQTDRRNCGACGMACDTGQVCTAGVCRAARACDDLLRQAPGTPSGSYIIDPDGVGGRDAFRVACDMTTDGGGWTLIAASVGETNMPRFDSTTIAPCATATPTAPCYMGAANFAALALTEFVWSTEASAVGTRAPIDNHREGGAPEVNAICINGSEYFRLNQDIASQGIAWTGCTPTEVYSSTVGCGTMFRPVWNLLSCEGIPISPGPRTSPDYNCSPFGRVGSACNEFRNIRHWRRGQTCPMGQINCGGYCRASQHDVNNCGACGRACASGEACVAGVCGVATSCADILRRQPGVPSGTYRIDPDGAGGAAGFPVYCDMTTNGGGWTLVAAAVGDTNMPRFTNNANVPCQAANPNGPCFMGRAALAALTSTEFAWSTGTTAVNTRAPIDAHTEGAPDTNAICINNAEYYRFNQDSASQGMGWSGCDPTEVYNSTATCGSMFQPVWNLLVCAGIPIAPGVRSSPDYNCSPFGRVGSACAGFYNIRHWRR